MTQFSLANLFGVTIRESANDGSDFTNPDVDYRRLFLGEDGLLHLKDSAGTVTDIGGAAGSVATDTIWDAAGDLVVGTGADTAAKLTKGATGTVPTAGASTLAYAFPPGYEFDYVQITTGVNVTGTTEGAPTTIITGTSQAYEAVTTIIEFYSGDMRSPSAAAGNALILLLFDGASLVGRLGVFITPAAGSMGTAVTLRYRLTPTAATHQYIVKAYASNTTGTPNIGAGSGGSGNSLPAYLRITKA